MSKENTTNQTNPEIKHGAPQKGGQPLTPDQLQSLHDDLHTGVCMIVRTDEYARMEAEIERLEGEHWWKSDDIVKDMSKMRSDLEASTDIVSLIHDKNKARLFINTMLKKTKEFEARITKLKAAMEQACQLANIATDWNLDEVEIDGKMIRTYELCKLFEQALETGE